jgi:hypothetical protein
VNAVNIIESHLRRNSRSSHASEQLERLTAVFQARCEARAILFAASELSLHEAVDALQRAAVASNLVDKIGQDGVQEIMIEAFARVRP